LIAKHFVETIGGSTKIPVSNNNNNNNSINTSPANPNKTMMTSKFFAPEGYSSSSPPKQFSSMNSIASDIGGSPLSHSPKSSVGVPNLLSFDEDLTKDPELVKIKDRPLLNANELELVWQKCFKKKRKSYNR
jgi:hypothetical protein